MAEAVKPSGSTSWSSRARQVVQVSNLIFNPARRRADLLYELASVDNYMTERTLFRNVGYWKNAPTTLDDACEAMAHLAGEKLQLGPADRLLDVGFGYGDQDIYWMEHFKPREIVGVNITQSQLEHGRKQAAARGMSDRIVYHLAQATELPFESNSFDKVVALESAFHFETRADFFREAFRVLRPGGRLVVLDIVPLPYDKLWFVPRMISHFGLHVWKACAENVYDRGVYEEKLRAAGFNARVDSVMDDTLIPFARYTIAKLDTPEYARKISYVMASMLWIPARIILDNPMGLVTLDYVLGVADKPM